MKKLSVILTFLSMSLLLFAANRQINGVVVDENGDPIIGASVLVEGSTTGTITDLDGLFELSVSDEAKNLVISFVGMRTETVAVANNLRIVLHEDTEVIQEVVVTGYGNVSKGSYVGSSTAISAGTIDKKTPSEVSKALAGEVAGLQVIIPSGQPGESAGIRLRGVGSVNGGTAPLYVVDGVPYDGDLSSINPGDIASVTVLKDATATSLYGSRGANGVILISTKTGTSDHFGKVELDVHYGANVHLLPLYDVISSPEEYVELAWLGIYNSCMIEDENMRINETNNTLFSSKGLPLSYNLWDAAPNALINDNGRFWNDVNRRADYANVNAWKDAIFRVGQKAETSIKFSGSSDHISYYTSLGYLKDEGYYIGSDYQRFSLRSNVEFETRPWMHTSLNVAYSYSVKDAAGQDETMNNGFAYVNGIPPIYPVFRYDESGQVIVDPKTGEEAYDYGLSEGSGRSFGTGINPAGSLRYDRDQALKHQLSAVGKMEFKLYDGLTFTINAAAQYLSDAGSQFVNAFYGDGAGIGRTRKTQVNHLTFTSNQLLEYSNLFGDHSVRILAGHESQFIRRSSLYGSKSHVAATSGPSTLEWGNAAQMVAMNSSTNMYALESYLATVSYLYAERYGISANYRADGSSKFAAGHRWGHFGSVGASWMFTNEPFLEKNKWIKNGKLRLSWGVQGNQDGITSDLFFDQYSVQYVDGEVAYVWGYKGNPDLTWERSQQLDLGLEFDVMRYLSVDFDYFYKLTTDMLFPCYVQPSKGYTYYYINGGKLENQGVELQLTAHAVRTKNFSLDIRFNTSHYANKVLELPAYIGTDEDMLMSGTLSVGHGLSDYYMRTYVGVDPETGVALYQGYYDASLGDFGIGFGLSAAEKRANGQTGTNYISNVYQYRNKYPDADIRTTTTPVSSFAGYDYVGKSAVPALAGGFGFDFGFYGVELSMSCSYGIGGYGYDYTYAALMSSGQAGKYNWHTDIRNAWNDRMTDAQKQAVADQGVNAIPRLSNGVDKYASSYSTRFLTSNSFLSLNNVRVEYTFPEELLKKAHIGKLSVYLSGDNLALLSARKGYHPMVSYSGSSNVYQYTPLSTVMGGMKIGF